MSPSIEPFVLSRFGDAVAGRFGLHFPPPRRTDLERALRAAAEELGFDQPEPCVEWLMSAPLTRRQTEILAGALTVGETYFFRDRPMFDSLARQIIPSIVARRQDGERHLRFWSAGCCSGEEPYSLAITLRRALPDLRSWNVTILGTDLNPHFLRKAARGLFNEWSFRDAPPWLKQQYFSKEKDGYLIAPEIRRMVTFEYLNLAEDVYPSLLNDTNAMDVIFCRNVLMYFKPEQASVVLGKLHSCLVDGGWLALSASEAAFADSQQFRPVSFDGTTLHRKAAAAAHTPPAAAVPTVSLNPQFPEVPAIAADESRAPAALYLHALDLYEHGRYPEAAVDLERICASRPNARAMMLLARCLANQGRLREALGWCDMAIAAEKLNPPCHYLRATILQELGAMDDAIRTLHRTVYLDPRFVLAHFALANLDHSRGRIHSAEKHFENALRLLNACPQDEILPESEGITAGRLTEIITSVRKEAPAA